ILLRGQVEARFYLPSFCSFHLGRWGYSLHPMGKENPKENSPEVTSENPQVPQPTAGYGIMCFRRVEFFLRRVLSVANGRLGNKARLGLQIEKLPIGLQDFDFFRGTRGDSHQVQVPPRDVHQAGQKTEQKVAQAGTVVAAGSPVGLERAKI